MYTLDSTKLLKALSGNQSHMLMVRWCIDYLYASKKRHSMTLTEAKKAWPLADELFYEEALNAAPEYLSLILGDKEVTIFSRTLKYHFEQERILKQMSQGVDIEEISASSKLKKSMLEQEVEVTRDNKGEALNGYKGMYPTRSYEATREVFLITGSFYSYLTKKYPQVDVDEKLKEVYHYFCQFEGARRHQAGIKKYIEAWLSGDLLKLNKIKKKRPQINKKKFYEDFLSE